MSEFVVKCRSKLHGDEISMVINDIVVHPNFTNYQNDIGKQSTIVNLSYRNIEYYNQWLHGLHRIPIICDFNHYNY